MCTICISTKASNSSLEHIVSTNHTCEKMPGPKDWLSNDKGPMPWRRLHALRQTLTPKIVHLANMPASRGSCKMAFMRLKSTTSWSVLCRLTQSFLKSRSFWNSDGFFHFSKHLCLQPTQAFWSKPRSLLSSVMLCRTLFVDSSRFRFLLLRRVNVTVEISSSAAAPSASPLSGLSSHTAENGCSMSQWQLPASESSVSS